MAMGIKTSDVMADIILLFGAYDTGQALDVAVDPKNVVDSKS